MGDLVLAFGPFRAIPTRRCLLEGDQPVPLGSRALEILLALLERPGEVVTKDALTVRVWPDTFVSEGNLRVQMAALRRALRDGQDGHRFIVSMPGRGYVFVAPVTSAEEPSAEPQSAPARDRLARLPATLTRIVGRTAPIQAIAAQLLLRRFVTVVGPGGIGKTTVALAAARQIENRYRDGAAFLDLSGLGDPRLVPGALAAVLDLTVHAADPMPAALRLLEEKQLLLVVDNCEHVVEAAAALVERVLEAAPQVHVLATSREPLRAVGERVHRLSALETPPAGLPLTAAEALTYPGLDLFVERASAGAHGFELSDADVPVIAEICRRLDGIALAIELAAGRVESLGLQALAAHLDDRFRLLTAGRRTARPRHQTLAATLDWSYRLLTASEQDLLRRLSVFAEPFSLDAAASVSPEPRRSEVVQQVANLAAKSLLNLDSRDAAPRYRMLDTTRLFGLEKLKAAGEHRDAARRHADHVRSLLGSLSFDGLRASAGQAARPQPLDGLPSLLSEVRAALDWAFSEEGDIGLGLSLTAAAVPLWVQLSLMSECRERVERALAQLPPDEGELRHLRMAFSSALGWSLMYAAGSLADVQAAWAGALRHAEALGDGEYRLRALWGLWINALNAGAFRRALDIAGRFSEGAAASSDPFDLAMADRLLGTSHHFLGDQAAAGTHLERALVRMPVQAWSATRFRSDQRVTARYFLARVLWLQGFPDQAARLAALNLEEPSPARNALTFGSVLGQGACPIALWTGDLEAAERFGAMLLEHAQRFDLRVWRSWARCFCALVEVKRGDPSRLDAMRAELDGASEMRGLPRYLPLIGEFGLCLGEAGEVERGLGIVADAIARCERNEELWLMAELLRIRGELILLGEKPGAEAEAETAFRDALGWAGRHAAPSLALRAATSLARLRTRQGRDQGGHPELAALYSRFGEGFGTADLQAARRIIAPSEEAAPRGRAGVRESKS